MNLENWAMGGVFIATIMIALTGFITSGIAQYDVAGNFEDGKLDKLEDLEQSTSLAQDAQQRAEQAEARSNFFTLPNVVNLLRLPFEAIPLWESFVGVTISVTGLSYAHGSWLTTMFGAFALITVAFAFARRVL